MHQRTLVEILGDEALWSRSVADEGMEALATQLTLALFESDELSSGDFERLLNRVADRSFLGRPGAWRITYAIESVLDRLSENQGAELRRVLVDSVPYHADWMGLYVTFEILAHHFPNNVSVPDLLSLADARPEGLRLLPRALKLLARRTSDDRTKDHVHSELAALANSTDSEVRDEALQALAALAGARRA